MCLLHNFVDKDTIQKLKHVLKFINFSYARQKDYQEKLPASPAGGFAHFQLSERIATDNFYHRLKEVLHLEFLYPKKKEYRGSTRQCKACNIKTECLGKSAKGKKFSVTYYREGYQRNNKRVNSKKGKCMKAKRQSTVAPVFGTLTQFLGLRKILVLSLQK